MTIRPPLLDIRDLSVCYPGGACALRHVDLRVHQGEVLGVVGESGSGKTTLIAAVMRLLIGGAGIVGGKILFDGTDLAALDEKGMRCLRGGGLALVGQQPMSTFNPVLTLGRQLLDVQYRDPAPVAEKQQRIVAMLKRVGIADPEAQLRRYPSQFSGGMLQRFSIAAALLTKPRLLIADEPTTALDTTTESQILALLRELCDELGCSILFVSHHLGSVASLCDRVCVLYAGEVMETGPVRDIFTRPVHPYTQRLLECDPSAHHEREIGAIRGRLPTIGGTLPDLTDLPPGCVFSPRCPHASTGCLTDAPRPARVGLGHLAACHKAHHERLA